MGLVIGEKEKRFMNKLIKYTDEPLGELNIVPDFLPAPKDLVFKEEDVEVTVSLNKASLDFFKQEANKRHIQYQEIIRYLLDKYVAQHNH